MSVASVRKLGRYALHRQIAAGGMASVHLGRLIGPAGFSRTVAIKRLHPQFAQDAHFVTMFLDEARVTGRIVHPNIVSTIDVVQERGELFIVMDFVHGAALSSLWQAAVARQAPIRVDVAVAIVLDALAGLHAAHEARGPGRRPLQVVHRDVSPHNILVGVDGLARIADFGIAKAVDRMQLTATGQIKGKLTYMAPEVIRGEDVDRRVDLYAMSIVLWELLTGRKLFSGNEASVLYDALEATVEAPSRLRPDLPAGLDEVVLKGLAKDRNDRYATAADFSEALENVMGPAPARRVGAWVAELAADDLEKRATLLEELESSPEEAPPLSETSWPGGPSPSGSRRRSSEGPRPADPEEVATRVERTLEMTPSDDARPARRGITTRETDDEPSTVTASSSRRSAVLMAVIGVALGVGAAALFLRADPDGSRNARPGPATSLPSASPPPAVAPVPSAVAGPTTSAAPPPAASSAAPSSSTAPSAAASATAPLPPVVPPRPRPPRPGTPPDPRVLPPPEAPVL